ncbi:MAG: enoyl-CoA hydratase-related protein [Bacteroidota bacterium]
MEQDLILTSVENRIASVYLNRPEKRNALSFELVGELKSVLRKLESDPEVKVILLKARGDAFCAGADLAFLKSLQTNTYEENLADSSHLKELFESIYTLKKVVIAQVEGPAIAGGCGLATICDVVFSVPEAKFGYTEVNIGFIPAIVSIFLIRKIGESKARELLLSGRIITAGEALANGMVNYVCEAGEIEAKVLEYATNLVKRTSASSLSLTKELIHTVQDLPLTDALSRAAEMNAGARATEDCQKGIAAFLSKEKLVW